MVITGLTTSGCVRATAVDAFQYNFDVVIPFECVADRSQISHKVNLLDLHMKYVDVAPSRPSNRLAQQPPGASRGDQLIERDDR